ncbi:MAG TPA: helix-turn-helix transcriptional regulator [Xanthobacteraceae bacterium]|nr:helix-turn-helix transcriptional regulator [Xanthobacteraceae bacterium]
MHLKAAAPMIRPARSQGLSWRQNRYCVNFYLDYVQMKAVQLRMARAAVGWGVRELAKRAGVTANTVTRIELGADAKQSTIDALQRTLEAAGIEFIPQDGGGPGVRLRNPVTTPATESRPPAESKKGRKARPQKPHSRSAK